MTFRVLPLLALLLFTTPVLACRQLVVWPDHLEGSGDDWFRSYRVVVITKIAGDSFSGIVVENFSDRVRTGQEIQLHFKDEELHAVCPVSIEEGQTYLIKLLTNSAPYEVSRFDWLTMPQSLRKFDDYVRDLRSASAANNRWRGP